MNVAAALEERGPAVQSFFNQLLTWKSSNSQGNTGTASPSRLPLLYRRPASANVPLSRIIRETDRGRIKRSTRAKKKASTPVSATTAASSVFSQKSRRLAPPTKPQKKKAANPVPSYWRDAADAFRYSQRDSCSHRATLSTNGDDIKGRGPPGSSGTEGGGGAATHEPPKSKKLLRQRLPLAQWALFRKRSRALRRRYRPTAVRRHYRRLRGMRRGVDPSIVSRKGWRWLPSHGLCCKRLHYVRRRSFLMPLSADDAGSGKRKYRMLAVPHHRVSPVHRALTRWVGKLPTQPLAAVSSSTPEGQAASSSSVVVRSPPAAFLADLSHFCVYGVTLVALHAANGDASPQYSSLPTADVLCDLLGFTTLPHACGSSTAPADASAWCSSLFPRGEGVYARGLCRLGHMRSAALSSEKNEPAVVPCTLIYFTEELFPSEDTDMIMFRPQALVVAPTNVAFRRRRGEGASPWCCSVKLLSFWASTGWGVGCPALSSLFEWWYASAEQWSIDSRWHSSDSAPPADPPCAAVGALSRIFKAVIGVSRKEGPRGVELMLVLPSWQSSSHPSMIFGRQVIILHVPVIPRGERMSLSRQHQEGFHYHFSVARRFFSSLLAYAKKEGSPLLGYRPVAWTIGVEDRGQLLRERGCAVFPADYGRDVLPSSKRRDRTESKAWTSVISLWGATHNAHLRLVARAADHGQGRRLPACHSTPGVRLLAFMNTRTTVSRLHMVGIVTSRGYFMQRLGTVVVPVWACFPCCSWLEGVSLESSKEVHCVLCSASTATQLLKQYRTACRLLDRVSCEVAKAEDVVEPTADTLSPVKDEEGYGATHTIPGLRKRKRSILRKQGFLLHQRVAVLQESIHQTLLDSTECTWVEIVKLHP